ncbi:Uncharacterised protein [Burkholderia pseudomallei]|nr:Uncharacterised protein [Burkholderia pseudomallei]
MPSTTKSANRPITKPPPMPCPCIAAMTGTGQFSARLYRFAPLRLALAAISANVPLPSDRYMRLSCVPPLAK